MKGVTSLAPKIATIGGSNKQGPFLIRGHSDTQMGSGQTAVGQHVFSWDSRFRERENMANCCTANNLL